MPTIRAHITEGCLQMSLCSAMGTGKNDGSEIPACHVKYALYSFTGPQCGRSNDFKLRPLNTQRDLECGQHPCIGSTFGMSFRWPTLPSLNVRKRVNFELPGHVDR